MKARGLIHFIIVSISLILLIGCDDGATGEGGMIDATTMHGKILAGYQGWFSCPGDGSEIFDTWGHWFHWYTTPDAVNLKIDMWPDLSEFDNDELFATNMNMPDGTPAMLFSSFNEKTVLRHFRWMREYDIDGVFVQRFVSGLNDRTSPFFDFKNTVMQNVVNGAETYGRIFAVEYDTTDADIDSIADTIKQDWMFLVDNIKITQSDRYLMHNGKPVLVIWGFGFNDGHHDFSASQAIELISWFRSVEKKYQATLVGGVPDGWRTCRGSSFPDSADEKWSEVYRLFDVILPWTVGRYNDADLSDTWKEKALIPDMLETKAYGIEYMPVVFPGFSFHNMHRHPYHPGEDDIPKLNEIPRNGGTFYWRQIYNAVSAFQETTSGYAMIKVAMFDEVDEGTAIFKIAPTLDDIPLGIDLVTFDIDEGYNPPGDWYLTLTGEGTKMLRGEIPLTDNLPLGP